MTHFLFGDQSPPAFPAKARTDEACIWLLAVMDRNDRARAFVSSVMSQYYERGYITDRQMEVLRSICGKTIKRWHENTLESQGAVPTEEQTIEFGNVVQLKAVDGGQVLE